MLCLLPMPKYKMHNLVSRPFRRSNPRWRSVKRKQLSAILDLKHKVVSNCDGMKRKETNTSQWKRGEIDILKGLLYKMNFHVKFCNFTKFLMNFYVNFENFLKFFTFVARFYKGMNSAIFSLVLLLYFTLYRNLRSFIVVLVNSFINTRFLLTKQTPSKVVRNVQNHKYFVR